MLLADKYNHDFALSCRVVFSSLPPKFEKQIAFRTYAENWRRQSPRYLSIFKILVIPENSHFHHMRHVGVLLAAIHGYILYGTTNRFNGAEELFQVSAGTEHLHRSLVLGMQPEKLRFELRKRVFDLDHAADSELLGFVRYHGLYHVTHIVQLFLE